MANEKDIKKSVEETVNQILAAAAPAENTAKAMPEHNPANGGEDKIRSGSPMTEEEKAEEAKKAKEAADEEEKKKKEKEVEDAKKAMADKDEKKDEKKEDKKDDDKKDDKKPAFMKKSIQELSDVLDAEELELIKAWREESEKEAAIAKSAAAAAPVMPIADLQEVLRKAVTEGTADIRKALDEKDTVIKSLSEKIEKMAAQPAYDRRSISTLEPLEKSGGNTQEIKKSQVLDKMLEMQAAGKGVTSHHITEFESTGNISNPTIRGLVFRELKLN